jgi:hypothetical protein
MMRAPVITRDNGGFKRLCVILKTAIAPPDLMSRGVGQDKQVEDWR